MNPLLIYKWTVYIEKHTKSNMGTYLILIIPILLLSMFVQWRFRNKFSKYAEMQLNSGLSGKEVAEKMLQDNGIFNVSVLSLEGQLTRLTLRANQPSRKPNTLRSTPAPNPRGSRTLNFGLCHQGRKCWVRSVETARCF